MATLRTYLEERRTNCYQDLIVTKNIILTGKATPQDELNAIKLESNLELLNEIIKLCENRKRF